MKKSPESLLKQYLMKKMVAQLATVGNNQPWICNIHFVPAEDNTIYWVSKPSRRHSQEIQENSKVAIGIAVKEPDHPVIGVQLEGDAQLVENKAETKKAMDLYKDRFKVSQEFYDGVVDGSASEKLYKFTPRVYVIFDEENFPDDPRQEWIAE